jgi:hypothetical protein
MSIDAAFSNLDQNEQFEKLKLEKIRMKEKMTAFEIVFKDYGK